MSATTQQQEQTDLDTIRPLVARKLRNADEGDEVWLRDRKTPLIINNIADKGDRLVMCCQGNGYDYIIRVDDFRNLGDCIRFGSRGSSENLSDDLQGVRHTDD
ncbi:hypothetical protein OSG_eHP32_00155 [environmental Halophage eHP-32]|nr:hypothetical protein OSG_eHP32_00155 [environmental Halophage eHP-32]